jgi:chromosome segregation ATPase
MVMMKRPASTGASASAKRSRKAKVLDIKEKLGLIAEAVKEAEQVPAPVRAMLVKMVALSLDTYEDTRHEFQAEATVMIGKALTGLQETIEAIMAQANEKLTGAATEKGAREATLAEATAKLEELKKNVAQQKELLDEAEAAAKEGEAAVAAASKSLSALEPETKEATKALKAAEKRLAALKTGALIAFEELKVRTTPPPEPEEPEEPEVAPAAEGEAGVAAASTEAVAPAAPTA